MPIIKLKPLFRRPNQRTNPKTQQRLCEWIGTAAKPAQ